MSEETTTEETFINGTEARFRVLEERIEVLETLVALIPILEARSKRVDVVVLSIQGDVRRLAKGQKSAQDELSSKVDRLLELLKGG